MSPAPGYGDSGELIRPVGLHSWEGSPPPILKRQLPAARKAIALGRSRIPPKGALASNEVLRVKVR